MKTAVVCIAFTMLLLFVSIGGCSDSGDSPPETGTTPSPTADHASPQPDITSGPDSSPNPSDGIERKAIDLSVLLDGKSLPSNVLFPSPALVTHIKANIDITIEGEDVDIGFINTGQQRFGGLVVGNRISGTIDNTVTRYSGKNAPSFPFEVPEETALYVEPETNIESDDPEIINTADGITAGATDAWDSATAIAEWVHDNIEPSAIGAGAKETLSNKSGDFTSQAYLTIAMCRATGIPSRLVGGLAYSGGKFAQHYWVECYMGDAGWVPLDPSVEEYGWADAPHLRLFQSGAIASLNSVSIVNYTETPEDANTPKSLDLAVGQSRRFAFVQSGTETIRNEYEVTNVREENGIRIYSIKSDLHVKPTGQCKATEVVDFLEIDAEVNPISYHTEKFTIGSG